MPFGDRTGPHGLGPRTGRAMGYCAGLSDYEMSLRAQRKAIS